MRTHEQESHGWPWNCSPAEVEAAEEIEAVGGDPACSGEGSEVLALAGGGEWTVVVGMDHVEKGARHGGLDNGGGSAGGATRRAPARWRSGHDKRVHGCGRGSWRVARPMEERPGEALLEGVLAVWARQLSMGVVTTKERGGL